MLRRRLVLFACLLSSAVARPLTAEDSAPVADAITSAIRQAIPLLEQGSAGSADERTCFTCHNQALPVLALAESRQRGFAVDEDNFKRQLEHTAAHLNRGRKNYLAGKGQGGKVITAGYALWALEAGEHQPDEVTASVTSFLLQYQRQSDHWRHPGSRPPSSGSDFTTTYVALRGLAVFGTDEQKPDIESRIQSVQRWLASSKPKETEDYVFKLRAMRYTEIDDGEIEKAIAELSGMQQDDGGWAQLADSESDAYATGTVLVALLESGGVSADDNVIRRGIRFLIDTQLGDGSWHVVTRAKPFQTYFESGFPHEKDQFISIAASSWATLALLKALPD